MDAPCSKPSHLASLGLPLGPKEKASYEQPNPKRPGAQRSSGTKKAPAASYGHRGSHKSSPQWKGDVCPLFPSKALSCRSVPAEFSLSSWQSFAWEGVLSCLVTLPPPKTVQAIGCTYWICHLNPLSIFGLFLTFCSKTRPCAFAAAQSRVSCITTHFSRNRQATLALSNVLCFLLGKWGQLQGQGFQKAITDFGGRNWLAG